MLVMLALSAGMTASAQVFQKLAQTQNEELFMPLHRGGIAVADINNDGKMDLIYGGQYRPDNDVEYETDENNERITDENGSYVVKSHSKWAVQGNSDDPNSWYSLGWACTGNVFLGMGNGEYERHVTSSWHEWGEGERIGMGAFGLIPTTFGTYHFFDMNNDGRLDVYVNGRNEWGWAYAGKIGPNSATEGENWYVALQKQNEDGTFTLLPNDFPAGKNEWYSFAAGCNHNVVFGDYDHDGYTDILVQTYHKWVDEDENRGERLVALYHNNGDYTFTLKNVFNPLPQDINPQPAGIFEIDEATLGDDEPSYLPTMKARPTSHGSTNFGDLDGDGWLDIIVAGYCDNGLTFTIYKNNQDGTFQEIDLSDKNFNPLYECDVTVADVNNDGWVDIIAFGTPGEGPKSGDVYLNNGDGEFNFTRMSVEEGNGLAGASDAKTFVVDLNHDGLVDMISWGWTNVDDMQWGTRIFYQNPDQSFSLAQNLGNIWGDAGDFGLMDVNGDGALDILGDYWFGFDVYLGEETEGIMAPEAPTGVTAAFADGKLTVSWAGAAPEYGYNLYVKNMATGWTSMLIPANTETGMLMCTENINVALRSSEYDAMSYTLTVPAGNYEVGVQSIAPDWNVSEFVKTTVNATDGIQGTKALSGLSTSVYDANGRFVGNSTANLRHGVYVVKQGQKTSKIVK